MKIKKIIYLLLVLIIVLMLIIAGSCGETATDNGGGNNNQNADNNNQDGGAADPDAPEIDPKEQYDPGFEPVDMGGYVFKFGTRDDDAPYHPYAVHTRDLFAETITGDLINDATYARNLYLEEKYNMKFEMDAFIESSGEDQANRIVERSVQAGDRSYDLLMTHMMMGFTSATRGVFNDIAQFPNIDISKPYWNRGANDGCSIGGKLYVGLSDLSFSTNENLYCIFFNKKLMQDYGVEDPYKLVWDNKWTFDTFAELMKNGTLDLNGDGVMDDQDQYGFISTAAVNFLWSGGGHMMKKDDQDIPVIDFINERVLTIYSKTYDIVNNENTFSQESQWFTGPTRGGITMF
ncbi:MAG: extracellular solute-binding protein, partial [Oscillospiraceae bacterium]|nr:extracellular solute-binding protein [Oscillospiraceae bacterium]